MEPCQWEERRRRRGMSFHHGAPDEEFSLQEMLCMQRWVVLLGDILDTAVTKLGTILV